METDLDFPLSIVQRLGQVKEWATSRDHDPRAVLSHHGIVCLTYSRDTALTMRLAPVPDHHPKKPGSPYPDPNAPTEDLFLITFSTCDSQRGPRLTLEVATGLWRAVADLFIVADSWHGWGDWKPGADYEYDCFEKFSHRFLSMRVRGPFTQEVMNLVRNYRGGCPDHPARSVFCDCEGWRTRFKLVQVPGGWNA